MLPCLLGTYYLPYLSPTVLSLALIPAVYCAYYGSFVFILVLPGASTVKRHNTLVLSLFICIFALVFAPAEHTSNDTLFQHFKPI